MKKNNKNDGLSVYNVGTGEGYSVLEMIHAFENVNHLKIKYEITARRLGDIDACYASNEKAFKELGFKTEKTLEEMCKSAYEFEKNLK